MFETPKIELIGNITAKVLDETGVEPALIIKEGSPWAVDIKWEMKGSNWQMIGGYWHVHLNLESIGPGPDLSLVDFADPDCQNQPLPSATGEYSCHFDVPGDFISLNNVPHQSLAMKLVVLLTYVNRLGQRGPIAAYWEGPIVQFYEDN
ncbi:MAG: hypothetical protein WAS33_03035 [Candidatus Promineifilaceae bacterium]